MLKIAKKFAIAIPLQSLFITKKLLKLVYLLCSCKNVAGK